MTLLSVENLNVTFRHDGRIMEAVKNVSLTIGKGEMLALVGESGSGKSLTALSCMGLLPAAAETSGTIRFDDADLANAPEATLRGIRGMRIGMIFQEPLSALNPLHTIRRQIEEVLAIHGKYTGKAGEQRVQELLELVGLGHFHDRLDSFPHQLSGGERQRVMIAMAIANGPDLLIADEPTTAVDVTIQAKILKTLKDLQHKLGMSILFITHDLTIVRRLADRVAVMKQGEIVEIGNVSNVFSHPSHPYTKHLLASEPKGMALAYDAGAREVIACDNLRVHFPIKRGVFGRTVAHVKAVDGISISLQQGATLGVVGESGSGKSTLGFALLRLVRSEGRVVFMGNPVEHLKGKAVLPLRKDMQLVFQDPYGSLNPRMTVSQIVMEGLLVHEPSLTPEQRQDRVDEILREVGLAPEMAERYPHEFSGGQRQRISIARAMVLKPRLVVLDEPTSALDLSVQAQIVELLRNFQHKYGLTYIFISHDLRVVRALSHRILVMKAGRVVEENETHRLFAAPRENYTKSLINAAFLQD